jgi:hypothetical protein
VKHLMIVSLSLLLSACGQKVSEPAKSEAPAAPSAESQSAPAVASDDSGFTDYAPQYPGSEIVEKTAKDLGEFSSTDIHMTTSASIADVSKFYRGTLAKSDAMPVTYDDSTPEKLSIMAGDFVGGVEGKTKTNLGTSLTVKTEDGKTNIYLLLNKPKS